MCMYLEAGMLTTMLMTRSAGTFVRMMRIESADEFSTSTSKHPALTRFVRLAFDE